MNDSRFFVEGGILFCNTMFLKETVPNEERITFDNSDPTKSWYEISGIESCNVVGMKGCCKIQMKSGDSSIIQMSFTELSEVKKTWQQLKK